MTRAPPALVFLTAEDPGPLRWLHGLAARSPARFSRRIAEVGWEVASSWLLDAVAPVRGGVLMQERGRVAPRGQALCLYAHWSPDGAVSEMVCRQVTQWRDLGFDVVFVSNTLVQDRHWERLADDTVLRIARRNVGRDFAAWRDAARIAVAQLGMPAELLLANDSVLGPIRPLAPLVDAWRVGGEGLFGLTESRGGGVHLQSYALLARGGLAVSLVLDHLAGMPDGRSKWRAVQAGEIGMTRRLQRAGVPCAALFGYEGVLAQVDAATRCSLGHRFLRPGALARYPLNPTHHLWRVLVEKLGFPYLKTELVGRNPGRLPGVAQWRDLASDADVKLIERHLSMMRSAA